MAKVYGHWITVNYRESYDLHASSGILFNHESPRRGLEFVTRKITHAVASIYAGPPARELRSGQPGGSKRDWGYAGDYVKAMWLMLQQDQPGRLRGVLRGDPLGAGVLRAGFRPPGHGLPASIVVVDEAFMRPAEVDLLVGNAEPGGTHRPRLAPGGRVRQDLVAMMVDADVDLLQGKLKGLS